MAKRNFVRNPTLHDQLLALAERAGERLDAALLEGAEIPFEVAENPGARSVLYHYKPLSGQFLKERFSELRSIDGFETALAGLSRVEGTSGYLRAMGASYTPAGEHDKAEQVLKELLAQIFDEVTSFELEVHRFDRAYQQFESVVYEDTVVNTVLVPLLGVRIAADRWELGAGMSMERGDLRDAPAEAVWGTGQDHGEPNTIAVLTVESTPSEPPPLTSARLDFRRLLTALRLFKQGPATLGPSAWWRTDDGPWQSVPLGFAGRARAGEYWLEADERPGFIELLELMRSRAAGGGSLPWALARFEQGLEQPLAIDGLSDHLLAVRALLDGGEPGSLAMSQRLAALCADSVQRRELEQRIEASFTVERLAMRGDVDTIHLEAIGVSSPDRPAHDLEVCLRALLRDMVCGHVDQDVRTIADRMLGVAGDDVLDEPGAEPATARTRSDRFARRAEPKTEPAIEGWDEVDTAALGEEPTDVAAPEPEFVVRRNTNPATNIEPELEPETEQLTEETAAIGGVRELRPPDDADDWGFDDPADYSAAV